MIYFNEIVYLFLLDTLSNFRHFYTFFIRGFRCSQFMIKLYEVNSELLLIEPHTPLFLKQREHSHADYVLATCFIK